MKWETVIGLETHAQLSTRSKMFSGAATAFGAAPNTQACAVDIALPGVLPVANRDAVEKAVRFGLAVNGNTAVNINRRSIFARKNYFYPDLPKGYQISQYEMPIVKGGSITIFVDSREKTIRLTRAHLEEDAGKSLHENFDDFTGIDLNRAGTPLLEIVSEPDMRSAQEAVAYAKALHTLVRWIDICDGNMQEGSFRCDANVSVRPAGSVKLGTRSEIKNLNSFRFLERAIEFEVKRQIEIIEDGGSIEQETRLYDAERDETRSMRIKEEAHDYRYFPDPDLLPLVITEDQIQSIRNSMPELPGAMRQRFTSDLEIPLHTATGLTTSRDQADFFQSIISYVSKKIPPSDKIYREVVRSSGNSVIGEVSAVLSNAGLDFSNNPIAPKDLADVQLRIADGTISGRIAREQILPALLRREGSTDEIIEKYGLKQISDSGELERICDQVIAANARQVEEYRAGKEKAFNSLVGQAMKLTKGKANPQQVSEILKRKLAG